MIFGQAAVIKSAHHFAIWESSVMDVMIFLKSAPAVIAGGGSRIECALKCRRRDLLQCRARQPHVEDFGFAPA
jgi:hypothetical protein